MICDIDTTGLTASRIRKKIPLEGRGRSPGARDGDAARAPSPRRDRGDASKPSRAGPQGERHVRSIAIRAREDRTRARANPKTFGEIARPSSVAFFTARSLNESETLRADASPERASRARFERETRRAIARPDHRGCFLSDAREIGRGERTRAHLNDVSSPRARRAVGLAGGRAKQIRELALPRARVMVGARLEERARDEVLDPREVRGQRDLRVRSRNGASREEARGVARSRPRRAAMRFFESAEEERARCDNNRANARRRRRARGRGDDAARRRGGDSRSGRPRAPFRSSSRPRLRARSCRARGVFERDARGRREAKARERGARKVPTTRTDYALDDLRAVRKVLTRERRFKMSSNGARKAVSFDTTRVNAFCDWSAIERVRRERFSPTPRGQHLIVSPFN